MVKPSYYAKGGAVVRSATDSPSTSESSSWEDHATTTTTTSSSSQAVSSIIIPTTNTGNRGRRAISSLVTVALMLLVMEITVDKANIGSRSLLLRGIVQDKYELVKNYTVTTTTTTTKEGPASNNPLFDTSAAAATNDDDDFNNVLDDRGLRILVAICAFDRSHQDYLQDMLDSFRDLCEMGGSRKIQKLHIHIYTTIEWPTALLSSLDQRASNCGGGGSMTITIGMESAQWGNRLSSLHRNLFYQNLEEYDLFVYTEDDLRIRPTHVVSFWRETKLVEQRVGLQQSTDYAIGFLRYETDPATKERIVWEHHFNRSARASFLQYNGVYSGQDGLFDDPDDDSTAARPLRRPLYFNGKNLFHQGMFMATQYQLEHWKNRTTTDGSYVCKFDDIHQIHHRYLPREYASSLQLFRYCNVTQLIPINHWQDFLVHHIPNRYAHKSPDRISVEEIDALIHEHDNNNKKWKPATTTGGNHTTPSFSSLEILQEPTPIT